MCFDGKDNIKLKTIKQLSDEEKNDKDDANNTIKQNDFVGQHFYSIWHQAV